jgi:hypothetical protein
VVACWTETTPYTALYALKSRNTCHFLIGLELSTQGCSRISVLEESMVRWGGQTYFALWKIVGNYLLGRKIWNHFASSRFLLLHLHKISQKNTPISHMQISLFYQFMVLLPYSVNKHALHFFSNSQASPWPMTIWIQQDSSTCYIWLKDPKYSINTRATLHSWIKASNDS